MQHPFADLIGLHVVPDGEGGSIASLTVDPVRHYNPQGVVHGAVLFALADTGMGAAIYPALDPGELCATIEIKISYFAAVRGGEVRCTSRVVNRGKRVASILSDIHCDDRLVAQASGSFAIFTTKAG